MWIPSINLAGVGIECSLGSPPEDVEVGPEFLEKTERRIIPRFGGPG